MTTTLDALPDWRSVRLSEITNDVFKKMDANKYAIVEYRGDAPTRVVSFVSNMYRFVAPRDYFRDLCGVVAAHMKGDVSVLSVRRLSSKVFVSLKLPAMFALTSDPKDTFGLTLVACNPYRTLESPRLL